MEFELENGCAMALEGAVTRAGKVGWTLHRQKSLIFFSSAYFGDRDRPFRRIVTAAQRAVLRVEILKHAVTMERFFRARQRQFGSSPYAGMTVAARVLPAVKVRDFSAPATCYAGSERPGSAKSGSSALWKFTYF